MDKHEFKKKFGEIAKKSSFLFQRGGWFKESNECIFVIDLQKSNYSEKFYLNIKIYIQGYFGTKYHIGKELVSNIGNIFRRQPIEYDTIFDLETMISDAERIHKLELFFRDFLITYSEKVLSKAGIKELYDKGKIFILQPVKEYLEIQ